MLTIDLVLAIIALFLLLLLNSSHLFGGTRRPGATHRNRPDNEQHS
jgi:hypothetical protein